MPPPRRSSRRAPPAAAKPRPSPSSPPTARRPSSAAASPPAGATHPTAAPSAIRATSRTWVGWGRRARALWAAARRGCGSLCAPCWPALSRRCPCMPAAPVAPRTHTWARMPAPPRNAPQRRKGSAASMTATVAAWGAIVLATDSPFAADSGLDLWARGSGIMSVSIFFEDSVGHRTSRCAWAHACARLASRPRGALALGPPASAPRRRSPLHAAAPDHG
jgi:hypothetical protein